MAKFSKKEEKSGIIKPMLMFIGAIIIIVVIIIAYLQYSSTDNEKYNTRGLIFPLGNIHWHPIPTITVCGQDVSLPDVLAILGPGAGPESYIGTADLHIHPGDPAFHMELDASVPSQITLGLAMHNIGYTFSSTTLMNKKNGDICPDSNSPGRVSVILNGQPNYDYENLVMEDGDQIHMIFQ